MAFDISDLLADDIILIDEAASSKKQLLQNLAAHAAKSVGLDERLIFDTLLQRERLGSTGIGNGIAIPHGKLAGLNKTTAIFALLRKPIEYEAVDEQPVDIVFLLLVPENAGADHLKAVSRVARKLRYRELVSELRLTADPATVFALLNREPTQDAA